MGRASALIRGIIKGVQHVTNPYQKLKSSAILSILHCLDCGHPSKAHTRRREAYVPTPREQLSKLIQETGYPGSRGFAECIFYYCDVCDHNEYMATEGHHDNDTCNGKHDEVQRQIELKGCPI